MDTSLNISPAAAPSHALIAPKERTSDKKVAPVAAMSQTATLPAERSFVTQVVTARLSGTEFPQNPTEITTAERTLRPYGTPMLPYEDPDAANAPAGPDAAESTDDAMPRDPVSATPATDEDTMQNA